MKTLILSFTLLLSLPSFAYNGFRCIPSMRSTRLQVLERADKIEAYIVNPMGYEFMPQFEGPASMFDISYIKMQTSDLKGLGDQFTIQWPKDNCKLNAENFTVSCQAEGQVLTKDLQSYGVSTTEITEKYESEVFEKRKFRLSLHKENIYFVTLEFLTKNCEKF